MKSIFKKTLGVLTLLAIGPLTAVVANYLLSETPQPIEAIKHGLLLDLLVGIGFVVGWYGGKFIAWCFKKD